jgi:hypothetical protein
MKKIYHILILTMVAVLLSTSGCSDILDETVRNKFEPSFFKTETGVVGGLTGLYAGLRRTYGQEYYFNACETGTDEYTYGSEADNNFKAADMVGLGVPDASNSRFDVLWNNAYGAINSASGIIDNAREAGLSEALIAEAQFFRGYYYFKLAETFGGVPLDLGGGILKFNTSPTRMSTRNTVPEVYSWAIFPDLEEAVRNLPETPRLTGTVTKNTARLILAKAYLTFGWWLENPNNVPTYPTCDRKGLDSYDLPYAQYFQKAYDMAIAGIDNPGVYGLQPTFYDVHVATNDRNNEIMLYADHTESSAKYSESNITGWDGGDGQNRAVWMVTWYFHTVKASSTNSSWTSVDAFFRTVQAGQSFSRMWSRMAPPIGVFTGTFADKTNDSRFNGTFASVYRGTWNLNPSRKEEQLYDMNYMTIGKGEPVVTFLETDPGNIVYAPLEVLPNTAPKEGYKPGHRLGAIPGKAGYVMPLTNISRKAFPGLWKLGPYRKEKVYNDDKIGSSRPYNILKFSELYFVAAEAAVKGATTQGGKSARDLINVIRARAGKWRFDVAANEEKIADNSAAMVAATPNPIDIDDILMERSREYFGEGYRWYDLARTQKWAEYASTYQIRNLETDEAPTTTTRTDLVNDASTKYFYLRPIPTSQLDNMDGDDDYKKNFQNPGYN